jgi:hypothetical protein
LGEEKRTKMRRKEGCNGAFPNHRKKWHIFIQSRVKEHVYPK